MDGRTCEPGLYKVKNSKQSGFSRRKKKLTTEDIVTVVPKVVSNPAEDLPAPEFSAGGDKAANSAAETKAAWRSVVSNLATSSSESVRADSDVDFLNSLVFIGGRRKSLSQGLNER